MYMNAYHKKDKPRLPLFMNFDASKSLLGFIW